MNDLTADASSFSGRTERFEIVARQVGDDLVVTIDRRDSNAPVEAALVSVQSEGKTALLRQVGSGSYTAKVLVRDASGAAGGFTWQFLVGDEGEAANAGGQPSPVPKPRSP